jgi:hypothetical protein
MFRTLDHGIRCPGETGVSCPDAVAQDGRGLIFALVCALASDLPNNANATSTPTATPSIAPLVERRPARRPLQWFSTLVRDHVAIWASPFRNGRDGAVQYFVPIALATSAALPIDRRIASNLPNTSDQVRVSKAIAHAGDHFALGGLATAFLIAGRARKDDRARETGVLALQAILHTHAVSQMMKFAAGRERPDYEDGKGRFMHRQQSFPSGHAMQTWAVATVISCEYSDNNGFAGESTRSPSLSVHPE